VTRIRAATIADLDELMPRVRSLNAQEGIELDDAALSPALRDLLADSSLGTVWLIEDGGTIGYAITTLGYDLEFCGSDAYLTEIWIDEPHRGRGAAAASLELIADELRARDVRALHLQVRPDNPALRLYERAGFVRSPRLVLTRRLAP
jgi:ribosomal protein S18 acetylase RimI-like enzyme